MQVRFALLIPNMVLIGTMACQVRDLPTSKRLSRPAHAAELVNAMPTAIAKSPDGTRIAIVHTGFGSNQNQGQQSITLIDTPTGSVREVNEPRMKDRAQQTFSFGICFGADGKKLYASVGSISDPSGAKSGNNGDGIAVYDVRPNGIKWDRFLPLPPVHLTTGKTAARLTNSIGAGEQVTFPAGIALFSAGSGEKLVVAEQLSDTVSILDVASGRVEARAVLGLHAVVPSAYPYNVVVDGAAGKAYVSLWNASQVVELDVPTLRVARRFTLAPPAADTEASSHPAALELDALRERLYVALANRDQIAAIDLRNGEVKYASTAMKSAAYPGLFPNGLALSTDRKQIFVSNASQNSVAVLDVSGDEMRYIGAFPTAWYPTVLAAQSDALFVATAKANGTRPNGPKPITTDDKDAVYIARFLRGSVTKMSVGDLLRELPHSTAEVERDNRYLDAQSKFEFAAGTNPIKHVVYIIKENRTYDQLFGDISGANGDPALLMYGEDVTPNQHALARQFGVLDNFYDSGEVSGNGHVWSTAAITSDYTERIWPIVYRGGERTYDFEGNVSNGIPLLQGISDVNEPATGYLWTNLARNHRTYRHYGEFLESTWCRGESKAAPEAEEDEGTHPCPIPAVQKGEKLPNGEASPYPWKVPNLYGNTATKRELQGHFDPKFPDFNLDYPDQLRADEFIREFKGFDRDGNLPEFIVVRLPNDHTSGAKAGKPSPRAALADNDLAVGRIVDAISHSKSWDDTAVFVLEDDAQNGQDHVDAHRSIALVISKYAPKAKSAAPIVESGFYTTVNLIHTMEALLGLPPMNANDAYAPVMQHMFSGRGEQKPFVADYRNQKNGMLYEVNPADTKAAKQSAKLDFSHADAADTSVLNRVLWKLSKGDVPMPKPVHNVVPASLSRGRDDD